MKKKRGLQRATTFIITTLNFPKDQPLREKRELSTKLCYSISNTLDLRRQIN